MAKAKVTLQCGTLEILVVHQGEEGMSIFIPAFSRDVPVVTIDTYYHSCPFDAAGGPTEPQVWLYDVFDPDNDEAIAAALLCRQGVAVRPSDGGEMRGEAIVSATRKEMA